MGDVDIEVGERVEFCAPGFPVTGKSGVVEGARPFALLVAFDDGSVGTWRRDAFRRLAPKTGADDEHERR